MKTLEALTGIEFAQNEFDDINTCISIITWHQKQIKRMKHICKEENFPTYHTDLNELNILIEKALPNIKALAHYIDNLDEL